ncbi:MAG: polyphenol oxidase family protein [Treponema sp.]|nr:polyphenol oxidase family protein [Treponema sp.]
MEENGYFTGEFYFHSKPVQNGPRFGMTMKSAGSMRFRWNETNPNRSFFLSNLSGNNHDICAVELIHSHTVFAVDSAEELDGMQGDGIITQNKRLIPVVTVADCMPIFLYEPESGVFGMLHSGWKGTGIVRTAIELAEKKYGAKRNRFCVVMGPHIHDCCYTVDEERAQYFKVNFTPDCVTKCEDKDGWYKLSLAKANLALLQEMGIDEGNIIVYRECTCCNPKFGSFRRETKSLSPLLSLEDRQKFFTVQAAWVKWEDN